MVTSFYRKGARNIIQRCLDLQPGQDLVIFLDETTLEPVTFLYNTAAEMGVQPTAIFIPQEVQKLIPEKVNLSGLSERMVQEVRAIITSVNGSAACTPFRKRLLQVNWSARTRVGHMPGASMEALKLAAVDFDRLVQNCQHFALALTRGQLLELESYARDGSACVLYVPLGGWDRIAVASDGIIRDGMWGNVPSGEAYIAPIENYASGSVVINGSIPGLVLRKGEEIVLHFDKGHLVHKEPVGGATAFLDDTQFRQPKEKGEVEWSNLAEIGIGLNPTLGQLTGNMLFDEKLSGTAHVALGDNSFMGGNMKSMIHTDMVTRSPTIRVDGHTIIDHGEISYQESDWQEDYLEIDLQKSAWASMKRVCWSGKMVQLNSGLLFRSVVSEPGKSFLCKVGNEKTAILAGKLYANIPSDGTAITMDELSKSIRLPVEMIKRVLHVMSLYELVHE